MYKSLVAGLVIGGFFMILVTPVFARPHHGAHLRRHLQSERALSREYDHRLSPYSSSYFDPRTYRREPWHPRAGDLYGADTDRRHYGNRYSGRH